MALKGVSVQEAIENYLKNDDVRRAVHDIAKTANRLQANAYAAGLFKQDYNFDPAGKASSLAISRMVDRILSEPAPEASKKDTVVVEGDGHTYSSSVSDGWSRDNTREPVLYTKQEAEEIVEKLKSGMEKDFWDEHLEENPEHEDEVEFRKEVDAIRAVPYAEWKKERDNEKKDTVISLSNGYSVVSSALYGWNVQNTREPALFTKQEAVEVLDKIRKENPNPEFSYPNLAELRVMPYTEWKRDIFDKFDKPEERPPITGPATALFNPLPEAEKGGYEMHKVEYNGKTVEAINFGPVSQPLEQITAKEREMVHLSCSANLIRDCLNRLDKNPDKDKHVLVLTDKFGNMNDMDWALGVKEGTEINPEPKWNQNGQQIEPETYSEARAVELADHFNKSSLPEGYVVNVFKANYYLENRLNLVVSEREAIHEAVNKDCVSLGKVRGDFKDMLEGSGAYNGLPVAVKEVLDKNDFERLGIFNNLRNMDFSGYDFNRDLTSVTLNNLNFGGSKFDGVVFDGVIAYDCNFSNCSMVEVKILDGGVSEFNDCKFNGANLSRMEVDGSNKHDNDLECKVSFNGCDFSNSQMEHAALNQAWVFKCNFFEADMKNCSMWVTDVGQSILSKCDLSESYLEAVAINSSVLSDVDFKGSTIVDFEGGGKWGIEIADSRLERVDFRKSDNLNEKGQMFPNSYISGSVLTEVNFAGAHFAINEVDYDSDTDKRNLNISLREGLRGEKGETPEHWRDANNLEIFKDNTFVKCNFDNVNLSYGVVNNCTFDMGRMSEADLFSSTFLNCKFNGTPITYSDMRFSVHNYGEFKGVNIGKTDASEAMMTDVTFKGGALNDVSLEKAVIVGSDFSASMRGGSLKDADLHKSNFNVEFKGENKCNLDGLKIDGVKCSDIVVPVCNTSKDVEAIAEKNAVLLPSSYLQLEGVVSDVSNKEFYTQKAAGVVCAAQIKELNKNAVKDVNADLERDYAVTMDCDVSVLRTNWGVSKVYGDEFMISGAVGNDKGSTIFNVYDVHLHGTPEGDGSSYLQAYPVCQSGVERVLVKEPILRPVVNESGVPVMITGENGRSVPKMEPILAANGQPNLLPKLDADGKPMYVDIERKSKTPVAFNNLDDAVKFMREKHDMALLKEVSNSGMVKLSNCVERALNAEKSEKTESKSASITD